MGSMKGIVEYVVKYPVLANILIALTLVAGVMSMLGTKKSFFPIAKDRMIIHYGGLPWSFSRRDGGGGDNQNRGGYQYHFGYR